MFGFNNKTSNTARDASSCAPFASARSFFNSSVVIGAAIVIAVLSVIILAAEAWIINLALPVIIITSFVCVCAAKGARLKFFGLLRNAG